MILEFDKNKKLLTPWGIATYGDKVNLQLEFDLPVSPCYQVINNIRLDIYKKGEVGKSDSLLINVDNFILSDPTTWFGSISFIGEKLLTYIQSLADTTAILDGQFTFQVSGNKFINSQVFFIKLYECPGPIPPIPVYPTVDEMNEAIDSSINEHNTSMDAHSDLLSLYASKEYVDERISGEKINYIENLTTTSSENHYTFDSILNTWNINIKEDGSIIFINNIQANLLVVNLQFNNTIPIKDLKLLINKTFNIDIFIVNGSEKTKLISFQNSPNGIYNISLNSIDNNILLSNIFLL